MTSLLSLFPCSPLLIVVVLVAGSFVCGLFSRRPPES